MVGSNQEVNLIMPYLPIGAEILYQDNQAVLSWGDLDGDGDGINEVFGFYGYHQQAYLFILKNTSRCGLSYFPVSTLVEERAIRILNESFETRAVYLFPALIRVISGSKWGYINSRGKFILPPIYDH